jgi:endoglucanase
MKIFLLFLFVKLFLSDCSHTWQVDQSQLLLSGVPISIKGINWFGFETKERCLEGLFANPISFYLENLSRLKFNALRIPVSIELVLYDTVSLPVWQVFAEPEAYFKTPLEVLDIVMEKAKQYHMLILLDIHRLHYGVSSPLWYVPNDTKYSSKSIINCITFLAKRYNNYSNLLGFDIFNEPHYMANYGSNNSATDWRLFIQNCTTIIFTKFPEPKFVLFVNGIDWGKNLSQYASFPPNISSLHSKRIVLSPHEYGPDLTWFSSLTRQVLYPLWNSLFGYLKNYPQYFICIGEWGSRFDDQKDLFWLYLFRDYMMENNMTNNFFWALNPYSKDVGGFMSSWYTWDQNKINFLEILQPHPSQFWIYNDSISVI